MGAAVALGGCETTSGTAANGAASQASSTGAGVGNSAGTTAGSADGASSRAAACGNGQLSVQLTMPDASAGHRSLVLLFTNTGGSPCTVSGYPGAAVTNKAGHVALNAQRSLAGYEGGAARVSTVTLSPGGHVSDVIEWLDAPTDGQEPTSANCPGVDGGLLLITPPNTTKTSSFSAPQDLCADFSVHPVVAGASGRAQS